MSRTNLIETIYQDLRTRILKEEIYPGQKISETALAGDYECSRTPIRETLKRLENDGLVVIKPKSGTYVKNETQKDFVELMQVRAALERLGFQLAMENVTDRDIQRVEKIKAELDELVADTPIDMMRFAQKHYEFHYTLISVSGNQLLLRQFERLNLRSSHMFYQMMDNRLAHQTQDEHETIIEFLRNRDPAGADFVQSHLQRKIRRYLGQEETT